MARQAKNYGVKARAVANSRLMNVPVDKIQFDPSYQRGGLLAKHKKIAAEFDKNALGIPLIGERADGSLWGVDGQQRIGALKIRGVKTVRAEVFASNGPEHEAQVFKLVNVNRTPLTKHEMFHALLTSHDPVAWTVKAVLDKYGLTATKGFNPTQASDERKLAHVHAIGTIYNIARAHSNSGPSRKHGKSSKTKEQRLTRAEDVLDFIIGTATKAWPFDVLRLKTEIVEGLWHFLSRHNDVIEKTGLVKQDKLIEKLSRTSPAKLIHSAGLGVGNRGSNVADVIDRLYARRSTPKKEQ